MTYGAANDKKRFTGNVIWEMDTDKNVFWSAVLFLLH